MRASRRAFLATTPLLLAAPRIAVGNETNEGENFPEFTERSLKSIRRGNEWLKKTFNQDKGCGVDIGAPSDLSCTAIVGLALQSDGSSPIGGPQHHLVRKCVTHIGDAVRDNRFRVNLSSQVKADLCGFADHHFAAMFFSQVLGEDKRIEPVKGLLRILVKQIGRGQSKQGHWGQGRYPRLAAVTGWVSLRGAHFAGLSINASADLTARYLIQQMKGNYRNLFVNASGIRVLYAMGMENTNVAKRAFDQAIQMGTKQFRSFSRFGGEQYLAFHYINEAMLARGGNYWKQWFPVVRDKLIEVQNSDGSWTGHSCITSRTFCTACALLVLTSPNRFLPISQV